MNERVKQLERQATETVKCGLNGTSTAESFNRKKFAELIVKECMSIAQEYDGSKLGGPGLIIAMRIEQHFGVEE
jgi:hypothetical protein